VPTQHRSSSILAIILFAVPTALAVAACGGNVVVDSSRPDSSGAGAGSGTGGGGTTTTSTTTGTATTTTTNTSTLDCSGTFMDPTGCETCAEGSCCQEVTDCVADAECDDCIINPDADPAVCNANPLLSAIGDCTASFCMAECGAPVTEPACDAPAVSPGAGACVTISAANKCNPITNEPCNVAMGEACDLNGNGFECYPAPNDRKLCEECGQDLGFCQGGLTCVGKCARFCCEDSDCGTGTCSKGSTADPAVGFCAAAAP
jgi:hypothetical protein